MKHTPLEKKLAEALIEACIHSGHPDRKSTGKCFCHDVPTAIVPDRYMEWSCGLFFPHQGRMKNCGRLKGHRGRHALVRTPRERRSQAHG